jgi:hypothetical protein
MPDRIDALREVTLAIAEAAAERDPGFAKVLGGSLRRTMMANCRYPENFHETLEWLGRFEAMHEAD